MPKSKGGLLIGKTDKDGGEGITVIAPEGKIRMGGGEKVIVENAQDQKHIFDGEEKTSCEIQSDLNEEGGGVKIPCGVKGNTTEKSYLYGGEIPTAPNYNKLLHAKELISTFTPRQVWQQTGWIYTRHDNKWKFEIPDDQAEFKVDPNELTDKALKNDKYSYVLSEVFDHPGLYGHYPEAKNIIFAIIFPPSQKALIFGNSYINPDNKFVVELTINPELYEIIGRNFEGKQRFSSSFRKITTHELQHFLQRRHDSGEIIGIEQATNRIQRNIKRARIRALGISDPARKKIIEDEIKYLQDNIEDIAYKYYISQPGEIEARDVHERVILSEDQRKKIAPILIDNTEQSTSMDLGGIIQTSDNIKRAMSLPKYQDLTYTEAALLYAGFSDKEKLSKTSEGEYYVTAEMTSGKDKLTRTYIGRLFASLEKKGYGYEIADDFTAKDKLFEFIHAVRMYENKMEHKEKGTSIITHASWGNIVLETIGNNNYLRLPDADYKLTDQQLIDLLRDLQDYGNPRIAAIHLINHDKTGYQKITMEGGGTIEEKIGQRISERQKGKEFKDTGVATYTRKYQAAYDIITLNDLQEIEKDNVAAYKLIEKSKIWPPYNVAELKQQGNSSGAAYIKVKLREFLSARPLDSKAAREVYVKNVTKLRGRLDLYKTVLEIKDFLYSFVDLDKFDFGDISHFSKTSFISSIYTGNLAKYSERQIKEYFEGIFSKKFYNFCKVISDPAKKIFTAAFLYEAFPKETRDLFVNERYEKIRALVEKYTALLSKITEGPDNKDFIKQAVLDSGISYYDYNYDKKYITDYLQKYIARYANDTKESISAALPKLYAVRDNDWSWTEHKEKDVKSIVDEDGKPRKPQNIFEKYEVEEPKVLKRTPLEFVKRTSGLDIGDISTKAVLENYGFKNIIYGNYVNDAESKEHTRHLLGAMLDLTEVLNISIQDINKLGGLDMNIGSTGCGAFSPAFACYFPQLKAINVTKKNGDGSIAHEWGHYLDNILAEGKEKKATNIGWATNIKADVALKSDRVKILFTEFLNYLESAGKETKVGVVFYPQKKYMYRLYGDTVETATAEIQNRYPKYGQYKHFYSDDLVKYYGYMAYKLNDNKPITVDLSTNASRFWINSSKFSNMAYYLDPQELFARAFEAVIEYKLDQKGRVSNYLVDIAAGMGLMAMILPRSEWPYPFGEDIIWLNDWMDRLCSAIRTDYAIKPFVWGTTERGDEYSDYAKGKSGKVDASVTIEKPEENTPSSEKGYGFVQEYVKDSSGETRLIYRLLTDPYGGKTGALGGSPTEVFVFSLKPFGLGKSGYGIASGMKDGVPSIVKDGFDKMETAKIEAIEYYKKKIMETKERYTTHFGEKGYTVRDTESGVVVFTGKDRDGKDAKVWAYEHNNPKQAPVVEPASDGPVTVTLPEPNLPKNNTTLYTKLKGEKSYRATNLKGEQVANLIKAPLIAPDKYIEFLAAVSETAKENPEASFQIREFGTDKVWYDSEKDPQVKKETIPHEKININESKTTTGKTVYSAIVEYGTRSVFIPAGTFNTADEIDKKAKKVLEELKNETYKHGMSINEMMGQKNINAFEREQKSNTNMEKLKEIAKESPNVILATVPKTLGQTSGNAIMEYADLEEKIIYELELQGEMDTSDAQGLLMANEELAREKFGLGFSAKQIAQAILAKGEKASEPQVMQEEEIEMPKETLAQRKEFLMGRVKEFYDVYEIQGKKKSDLNYVLMFLNTYFEEIVAPHPEELTEFLSFQEKLTPKARIMASSCMGYEKDGVIFRENVNKNIWELIPDEFKKYTLPKCVHYSVNHQDKGLIALVSPFIGYDELRPVMMGVHFDNNGIVATNAHTLIFLNHPAEREEKTYCINKGCLEATEKSENKEARYPRYQQVIPDYDRSVTIATESLISYLSTIIKVKYMDAKSVVYVTFGEGESIVSAGFNANLLLDSAKGMYQLGYHEIDIAYAAASRAICMAPKGKSKNIYSFKTDFILVMPVYLGDDPLHATKGVMYLDGENECVKTWNVDGDSCINPIKVTHKKIVEEIGSIKKLHEKEKQETEKRVKELEPVFVQEAHGIKVGDQYKHVNYGIVTVEEIEENHFDKKDRIPYIITMKTASGKMEAQGIDGFIESIKPLHATIEEIVTKEAGSEKAQADAQLAELNEAIEMVTEVCQGLKGKAKKECQEALEMLNEMLPKMDTGGKIKNQYEGKSAKEIWELWDADQRTHFLEDHTLEIPDLQHDFVQNVIKIYKLDYDQLSDVVKDALKFHIESGSYEAGGKIGGRGYFGLKPGKRITSLSEFKDGDVILGHSRQFNANNTYKVTGIRKYGSDGSIMHVDVIYWNPIENKRIGDEDMSIAHDFQLEPSHGGYWFPKDGTVRSTEDKEKLAHIKAINNLKMDRAKLKSGSQAHKELQAKITEQEKEYNEKYYKENPHESPFQHKMELGGQVKVYSAKEIEDLGEDFFTKKQKKNILSILGKVKHILTDKAFMEQTGGNICNMGFKLKDDRWLIFNNESDSVMVSEPFATNELRADAAWENPESVYGTMPGSLNTERYPEYSNVNQLAKDILAGNFIKDSMETGGKVGGFEYKTVNTRTEAGLKEAEKLKEQGWKIISSGTETIQFERPKTKSKGGKFDNYAYVVFYSSKETGGMRENMFTQEEKADADEFAKQNNSEAIPLHKNKEKGGVLHNPKILDELSDEKLASIYQETIGYDPIVEGATRAEMIKVLSTYPEKLIVK